MKLNLIQIGFIYWLSVFASAAFANENGADLPILDSLESSSHYSQLIIALPPEVLQSRDKRFIALDPQTQRVEIVPAEISMKEEAESFSQHTNHYIAFWSIFSIMFGMDILWAE